MRLTIHRHVVSMYARSKWRWVKAVSQSCSRGQVCNSGRLRGYDGSLLFSTDFSSLHHSSVVECVPDVIPYCLSQQRIATTPNWKPLPSHPVMLVMKMMRKSTFMNSMLSFIYKKIEGFSRMVRWCCQWRYKAIESSSPWSHLTTPRSKINLSRHKPHLRFNFSFLSIFLTQNCQRMERVIYKTYSASFLLAICTSLS